MGGIVMPSGTSDTREALRAIEHAAHSVEETAAQLAADDDAQTDLGSQATLGRVLVALDDAKEAYRLALVTAGALAPPS
jgi:hypothetical protein